MTKKNNINNRAKKNDYENILNNTKGEPRTLGLRFLFRIIIILLLTIFLIWDFYRQYTEPLDRFKPLEHWERMEVYYSYWTTQTNYIVLVYFIWTLIQRYVLQKEINVIVLIGITTYITTTMFIFWIGVISAENSSNYTYLDWLSTIILHLCVPVLFIIVFSLYCGVDRIFYKNYSRKWLWKFILYPTIYLALILLRGELKLHYLPFDDLNLDGVSDDVKNALKWARYYPYNFLDYHNGNWLKFMAGCILVTASIFGFQYLYVTISNAKFYRNYYWNFIKKNNLKNN
ncbi:hypothetical protein [Spiroplasma endosymbiont of Labia minor]|uniref:hypothetical protein n=1 Tax=Spiroplasma endosymbiont of Labia minor TaxID=3066305 RepID=UPI0030CCDEB9